MHLLLRIFNLGQSWSTAEHYAYTVSIPVENNLFFCPQRYSDIFTELKAHWMSRGNGGTSEVILSAPGRKPGLGLTIMVFTAGSQRDHTQPGAWIRSKLLCCMNPAVPKERGKSNCLRTSAIFRSGMGLVLDPRWYAAITAFLYRAHAQTCSRLWMRMYSLTHTHAHTHTHTHTDTHYLSVSYRNTWSAVWDPVTEQTLSDRLPWRTEKICAAPSERPIILMGSCVFPNAKVAVE